MENPQANETAPRKVRPELSGKLGQKLRYLDELTNAIDNFDDRQVYELVDPKRYNTLVRGNQQAETNHLADLVTDLHQDLSHYLSVELIAYLKQTYPFFYVEEPTPGHFDVFFGNWWDRRQFGELDVLNARFVFDSVEYDKLTKSFELEAENKNYNSDRIKGIAEENQALQDLVDGQEQRDLVKERLRSELKELGEARTLFNGNQSKQERQEILDQLTELANEDDRANNAYKGMKANEDESLVLSKEDTILSYEKQAIRKVFGDFSTFKDRNERLYVDYISHLIGKGIESKDETQLTNDGGVNF
ncbi:exonuclease SbcC [Furfurilactobacillus sp. WILCCON 0119]|uniref:exonuclease SbcC n=1 Tax=Furfurilactobacillus entadae TaxID=2922307 RepID=UPI0035EB2AED